MPIPCAGIMPDEFARKIIGTYIAHDLKGRLAAIETRYRDRAVS